MRRRLGRNGASERQVRRLRRRLRARKRIVGTAERPRLVVHRSHLHLYAQVVDDFEGKTLLGGSTLHPDLRERCPKGGDLKAAKELGGWMAERALAAGIRRVVFDRAGYLYHGRVKALADAAREKGLEL